MGKRKTRRLGAIAVMLSLIGLIVPMLGSVYAADTLSTKLYWGYRVESTSNTMVCPLYVLDDGNVF